MTSWLDTQRPLGSGPLGEKGAEDGYIPRAEYGLEGVRVVTAEGFAAVPNWIVRDASFTSQEKLVYLVLASHIGQAGTWAMSHADIAAESGFGTTAVKNALKSLRERGLVDWENERANSNAKVSNRYRIQTSLPPSTPGALGRDTPMASTPGVDLKKNPGEEPDPPSPPEGGSDAPAEPDPLSFEAVWALWPKKDDRVPAQRAWNRLSKTKRREILPRVEAHARAHAAHTPRNYIPGLGPFLNQQKWENTLAEPRPDSPTQPDIPGAPPARPRDEYLDRQAAEKARWLAAHHLTDEQFNALADANGGAVRAFELVNAGLLP